jgi:hypothetical protein
VTSSPLVGIDRRVRLEWLDAIAARVAAGDDGSSIRRAGHELLRAEFPGTVARGKTLKVLLHFWVYLPDGVELLRDDAVRLWRGGSPDVRRALHWGLGVATYPYWADMAAITGRLLGFGDTVTFEQIHRRLNERWGQRPLIFRTARHVVRSWVDWGVLQDAEHKGVYRRGPVSRVEGDLARWLSRAALVRSAGAGTPLRSLLQSPLLFPFRLDLTASELRRDSHFLVERQGLDEDIIALRPSSVGEEAATDVQMSRHRAVKEAAVLQFGLTL